MKARCFIPALLAAIAVASPSFAAPASGQFKKNNPDGGKYEFARSYISALSYLDAVDQRWKKKSPKKMYAGDEVKVMRGYVAFLIQDNADLRIAKNYLQKYLKAPNALIRKTADSFITACMTQIAINDKEKQIWDQWYAVKSNKLGSKTNEGAFVRAQAELAFKRKETDKTIVESTIMLTQVLKSSKNADEKGKLLAITAKQRGKLLDELDEFGKGYLDWGLKPGQDHMEASVGVLRELLEDSIYTPLK